MIRELESDGWFQVRHKGSHGLFHHAVKFGTVTVLGVAEAISMHVELMREHGEVVPPPSAKVAVVRVAS
jgi:predicted RNA binding protein YcfA (HicA-like mRNA interferase family)